MGFPMAVQLFQHLSPSATFAIYDVDSSALNRFIDKAGDSSQIYKAQNSRDVAEHAVSKFE